MKACSGCHIPKDLSEFHKHKGRKFNVTEYCKLCRNILIVSKRYKLTPEAYIELLEGQEYRCGICGTHRSKLKKGLAVDHDHITGKIRGLLCGNCNNGIGRFKDDAELLHRAIIYLI